jgi:outer membrane lipopolysaccharide assembly protein LptE/RlpB
MAAVNTLSPWAGPAIAATLWVAAAGFTLSQLATVAPSLRTARAEAPRGRGSKQRALRKHMQAREP